MVPYSGWGSGEEVGGTDLAAPAPTHTRGWADAVFGRDPLKQSFNEALAS
jgi:hypothetical protein